MSTFESIRQNLDCKFLTLEKIIDYIKSLKLDIDVADIGSRIEHIKFRYITATFMLVQDYTFFQLESESDSVRRPGFEAKKNRFTERLKLVINLENTVSQLTGCKDELFNKITDVDDCQIRNLRRKYNNLPEERIAHDSSLSESCSNCSSTSLRTYTYKTICNGCGKIEEVKGNCFDDESACEIIKSKYGSYDPIKRCRAMVDQIQARESKDIPEQLIEDIKALIKQDNQKGVIDCEQFRKYLQRLKKPTYNEHIPLIRKKTTGYVPPQLTDAERIKLNMYIEKVITIVNDIKPTDKPNCPYHAYLIFKILQQILPKSNRRDLILECIHLQSRETLIENDRQFWEPICKKIPKFKYMPTVRTSGLL